MQRIRCRIVSAIRSSIGVFLRKVTPGKFVGSSLIEQSCVKGDILLALKSCSTLPLPIAYAIDVCNGRMRTVLIKNQILTLTIRNTCILYIHITRQHYMRRQIKVKRLEGSPFAIEYDVYGRGASATIVKAYNLDNLKEELVCKVISFSEEEASGVYKTELQILKELPVHPNLVNYKKIQISSERNLYIIMEFCNGGNLDKYMFDCKYNIPEDKIWFFIKQFCDGYQVLYEHALIHRDIKPENILMHNGNFKIADFGLSKTIHDPQQVQNLSMKGTPLYMAPEIPQTKQGNSKIDVFSLGIVLFRMAFKGQYPFFDQGRKYRSINEYFKELKLRKMVIPEHHNRSEDLVELIKKMLCKDHQGRISWKELFEHPRIVKAVRAERKKEMTSMDDFKKSLIFVNKSITKIEQFQQKKEDGESKEELSCLILEEAFNKTGKTAFQRKLYRFKLIYTIIQYVSSKIRNYMKGQQLHPHIKKTFQKLIIQGLQFSLYVIHSLRNISGQWESFSQLQIINFENIFENDRIIVQEELQKVMTNNENKVKTNLKLFVSKNGRQFQNISSKVIKLSYEDLLYTFLTDFGEYPAQLKADIMSITALLVEVYDLVVKFDSRHLESEENIFEKVEGELNQAFFQYLLNAQKSSKQALTAAMAAKGLILQ